MASKARELANLGNAYSDGALSNRNLLINSDFKISQRGDYSSATAISTWTYYADRFKSTVSTISGTIQYTGDTVKLTATSTGSNARILTTQAIERINIVADKQYTFSAKVRSNTSNARILVYINGAWQTGATHSGNGQWEDLSVTVTSQSAAQPDEVWIRVGIMDGSGNPTITINSGDYVEARLLQFEVGDTSTPFEYRSIGQELFLCQRYFQAHGDVNFQGWNHNIADTGGTRTQAYSFPVTMRATPSITYQDNSGNSQRIYAEYPNSTSGNNITFNFYANSSCIMGFKYPYGNLYGSNGDSYMISAYALKLDAEL